MSMPTCQKACRASCSSFAALPVHLRSSFSSKFRLRRSRVASQCFSSPYSTQDSSSRHHILTLLYKTKNLIPHILRPKRSHVSFLESVEFWDDVLATAYDDYQSPKPRVARFVVYGTDSSCYSEELVTALLSEPFTSDEVVNQLLHDRYKNHAAEGVLTISHSQNVSTGYGFIQIPSTFLQQFSVPLQVTELTPSKKKDYIEPSLEEQYALALFKADFPVIVCNPVTTPIPNLFRSRLPINSIVALVSAVTPDMTQPASLQSCQNRILFLDPLRAINAIGNLRAAPTLFTAIQRYQDEFIGSQISSITDILRTALDPRHDPLSDSLQTRTILAQIRGALSACSDTLNSAQAELDEIMASVRAFSSEIQETRLRVCGEVFGGPRPEHNKWGSIWPPIIRSHPEPIHSAALKLENRADEIAEALRIAEKNMKSFMVKFTLWRLLWRVDEVSCSVIAAVNQTWCPELEKKLIMHAGRLVSLQDKFTTQTFSTLQHYQAKDLFNSAILNNALQQRRDSLSYELSPTMLAEPLYRRKSQLIAYPTMQLHVGGQRAALGMSTGILASASFGWLGWFGWLSNTALDTSIVTGSALLSSLTSTLNLGVEPGTAIGFAAFGSLISVRWAVGKWERAKKRWWEDWMRICQGLERDLKSNVETIVTSKVTVIAEQGCTGVQQLAENKMQAISIASQEIRELESALQSVEKELGNR